MGDSDRYVPPPPPYELSLQHDQKVIQVQPLDAEVSKDGPFRVEEKEKDGALSDKTSKDVPVHALPSAPKYLPRQSSRNSRALRPLPTPPQDTCMRGQGSELAPVAEVKSSAGRDDYATEPHTPAPSPFSPIGHSLDEASYTQRSAHHSAFHYLSHPSYDTPRRRSDDRWRVSAYEPYVEASFRRSSHTSFQSPSYSLPQDNDGARARLLFDPSIAYSDSQARTRSASPSQRGASLYSSAVSPYLHPGSAVISGSRQYVPLRPASWSTQTLRPEKTDSVRTHAVPATTLYVPRTGTQIGYEQRWSTSESDIDKRSV